MLPGIGSSGLSLAAPVAGLSDPPRTFAIDNIHDVGRSVETRPARDAGDFVAWLDEVRAGLGFETVEVVGLSYGGWIAARYTLAHPERVRRLVLLAPGEAAFDALVEDGILARRSFKSRKMVAPLPLSDEDWRALGVPTLFLAGDREVVFSPRAAVDRLRRLAPDVRIELLEGAGHHLFVARAADVNARILAFLGR